MRETICIVTPTFNSERFLEATIASVVAQASADIALIYHIQDGGSTDGTDEILQAWRERLKRQDQITFTFSKERDQGMYQAINRGFACLPIGDCTLMGWINADDLLAPSAIATALAILRDVPEVDWVSGRLAIIDEAGTITRRLDPGIYNRGELRGGLYSGRKGRRFVQQEGSFWRPKLWRAVDGLDECFRLAGDWDLWRRFADFASLTVVGVELGYHRRRLGQLSQDRTSYYYEVDRTIEAEETITRASLPERVQRVAYDIRLGKWAATELPPKSIIRRLGERARRLNWRRIEWKRRYFGRKEGSGT